MEEWKDIPSRPGYQASSEGRIRRKEIVVKDRTQGGDRTRVFKERVLKAGSGKGTYAVVGFRERGKKHTQKIEVHRLVAEAFLGPLPDGCHTHHKDENQKNNSPDNLEYIDEGEHHRLHALKMHKLRPSLNADDGVSHDSFPTRIGCH